MKNKKKGKIQKHENRVKCEAIFGIQPKKIGNFVEIMLQKYSDLVSFHVWRQKKEATKTKQNKSYSRREGNRRQICNNGNFVLSIWVLNEIKRILVNNDILVGRTTHKEWENKWVFWYDFQAVREWKLFPPPSAFWRYSRAQKSLEKAMNFSSRCTAFPGFNSTFPGVRSQMNANHKRKWKEKFFSSWQITHNPSSNRIAIAASFNFHEEFQSNLLRQMNKQKIYLKKSKRLFYLDT